MSLSSAILYRLARRWPSPMAARTRKFGAEPGTDAYELAYAAHQFRSKVREGFGEEIADKDILEIGCGHGGITCYLATSGARRVIGIDINQRSLRAALRFAAATSARFHPDCRLPVSFIEMSANDLAFGDGRFDLVVADNVFEHFMDPPAVLREAWRVLRPGGHLYVPSFSSIYSKYGLHLKHGLKLPWANSLFSERTIISAMQRLALDNPTLEKIYPGLRNGPARVRDLRAHRDLNDITYRAFERMAQEARFEVVRLQPVATRLGRLVGRVPLPRLSRVHDVLSFKAEALLRKPNSQES